ETFDAWRALLAEFNRAQQAGEAPDLWNMVLPNTGKRLPDCTFDEVHEAARFLAALEAPGAAAMAAALAHEPPAGPHDRGSASGRFLGRAGNRPSLPLKLGPAMHRRAALDAA